MTTRVSTARRRRTGKDADDYFPTILSSEDLMALVLTSPAVLELRSIVQFPNFVPGSYSFQDFLDTFAHNDTTHTIRCSRHFTTGFSDDQFCLILRAMARLPRLRRIIFVDGGDSRLRQLRLSELARLVHSVPQLRTVVLGRYWLLTGDDDQRILLARALAQHPSLRTFHYAGCGVKPPSQQPSTQRPTAGRASTTTATSTIQLYQAIAPRSDPDAVVTALTTCLALRSIRITHSPYCARDYSIPALGRLLLDCVHLRDCALVTKVVQWAPLLGQLGVHHTNNNNNNNHSEPTCGSLLQRLVLITAEQGLTLVDALGSLAVPLQHVPVRQLSLRFWGGPFHTTTTLESVAQALRVNPYLRLLELSEGRTTRDDTYNDEESDDDDDNNNDNNNEHKDDAENDMSFYGTDVVPPKMILPIGSHAGSLNGNDLDTLTAALCDNPKLQIRLDVGIAAIDQDALDRLKMQSNLNAVRLVLLRSSTTNEAVAPAEQPHELLFTVSTTLERLCRNDDPVFGLTCSYGFLRTNPLVWCQR